MDALAEHLARESQKEVVDKKNPLNLKVGDTVCVKAATEGEEPYVAQIVAFGEGTQIKLRWYCRPEDSHSGRQAWHGSRELFSSNTTDWNHIQCVESKCYVHSIEEYESLGSIGPADFYSRFSYEPVEGRFRPDVVPVFCYCEIPYNPDQNMVMCENCKDWFHWTCVSYNNKTKAKGKDFYCEKCKAQRDKKTNT